MSSPATISYVALPILLLLFFASHPSFSTSFSGDGTSEMSSMEFFPMEGNVACVVQISDLHLSAYHPERGKDLLRFLAPALQIIRPDLVLVTGDITDAKSKGMTSSRQDESEWIQYRNSVDAVVELTGIDKRRVFDIRGNHDKYGVPYVGSDLDFFYTHSVSSQFNRLDTVQSITLMGDDQKYIFVGIDDTMHIGIRGPSNLFGHPTSKRIAAAEAALQYWNPHPDSVTKIVFGHFPMSFTASSEKGKRYESLFANQSISAYICGHLHATFGKQLWRLHEFEPRRANRFWEWELGDWKDNRFIRILSIDRGEVSFLDIELPIRAVPHDEFHAILITYPIDSRLNNRAEQHNQPVRNDISALVFSARSIINVTAKIFDSSSDFMIIKEIWMQPTSNQSITKPLFHAKWDIEDYRSDSAARYWLQIFALDSAGNTISSDRRPFSVEGRTADFSPTWMVYLIFYLQWENIYSIFLWSNICFLIVLLCLPKFLYLFKENDVLHLAQRNHLSKLLLFLIEGSRRKTIWSAMVIYLLYLLFLPWFWGFGTSQNGDISEAYLFGWRTNISGGDERIGAPDLMTISLPFMYLVIAPLFLTVYSLYAERFAAYLHISGKTYCPVMKAASVPEESGALLESYKETGSSGCMICSGWLRKSLLFSAAVIACIHLKLAVTLMRAYGTKPVALSPAVSCAPLLLLTATIWSTRRAAGLNVPP